MPYYIESHHNQQQLTTPTRTTKEEEKQGIPVLVVVPLLILDGFSGLQAGWETKGNPHREKNSVWSEKFWGRLPWLRLPSLRQKKLDVRTDPRESWDKKDCLAWNTWFCDQQDWHPMHHSPFCSMSILVHLPTTRDGNKTGWHSGAGGSQSLPRCPPHLQHRRCHQRCQEVLIRNSVRDHHPWGYSLQPMNLPYFIFLHLSMYPMLNLQKSNTTWNIQQVWVFQSTDSSIAGTFKNESKTCLCLPCMPVIYLFCLV